MAATCWSSLLYLQAILICHVLIIGGTVSGFMLLNVGGSRTSRMPMRRHPSLRSSRAEAETKDTFILPIFPLRKSVRVPSEALTLNLYEPRYLKLAEHVLEREPRWFGAMYCSKKPQFIREGDGPIVPMVEPGDIGSVCTVLYDEEGLVPVSRTNDDGSRQRRIKLKALTIGRFRTEKVLHNGYGGGSMCGGDNKVQPLPFILVEASRIDDAPIIRGSREVELETKICKTILAREGLKEEMLANLCGCLLSDEVSQQISVDELMTPFLPPHLIGSDVDIKKRNQEVNAIDQALSSWTNDSLLTSEDQRRQIFSFAAASIAVPEKPANEGFRLLRETLTYDRLMYAYDKLQKNQSWLSIFNI